MGYIDYGKINGVVLSEGILNCVLSGMFHLPEPKMANLKNKTIFFGWSNQRAAASKGCALRCLIFGTCEKAFVVDVVKCTDVKFW